MEFLKDILFMVIKKPPQAQSKGGFILYNNFYFLIFI